MNNLLWLSNPLPSNQNYYAELMKRVESLNSLYKIVPFSFFTKSENWVSHSNPIIYLFYPYMFKTSRNGSLKNPSYSFAHWFFGRCLGLVTLTAFLSYWVQADALIGTDGLFPWQQTLYASNHFLIQMI